MEILSTENGIPEKVKFTNFDSEDNSSITELNSNASFRSKSGELFFGGVKGLVHFFPNKIKGNTNIPNIAITSFKIFEKEAALDSSILLKKRIELSRLNLPLWIISRPKKTITHISLKVSTIIGYTARIEDL